MRIAIVNDLQIAVNILVKFIERQTSYEIAWIAYNGAEAIEKCQNDTPDVILMDLIMPVMDGVEAIDKIMQKTPCAILIVTANVSANLHKVYEGMGRGALDVVATPSLDLDHAYQTKNELLSKLEVIRNLLGLNMLCHNFSNETDDRLRIAGQRKCPPLLLVGASTGGPKALSHILGHFPANVPFATVVIQHLNEEFMPGLIEWLSQYTSLTVQPAQEGVALRPGHVYLPTCHQHLAMTRNGCITYVNEEDFDLFQPSIDVLFSSAANVWPVKSIGLILTGMGMDGARGLKQLKEKGWHTIAQDRSTSVVYGMPKAADELGGVSEMVPLDEIPKIIMERLGS